MKQNRFPATVGCGIVCTVPTVLSTNQAFHVTFVARTQSALWHPDGRKIANLSFMKPVTTYVSITVTNRVDFYSVEVNSLRVESTHVHP